MLAVVAAFMLVLKIAKRLTGQYMSKDVAVFAVPGTWADFFAKPSMLGIAKQKFASLIFGPIEQTPQVSWFEEGSEFNIELSFLLSQNSICIKQIPIKWAQHNTFTSRRQASEEIISRVVTHVDNQRNSTESYLTPVFIIAHSHGGNAAVLAAKKLRDKGIATQVITLATPFISVARPESSFIYQSFSLTKTARIIYYFIATYLIGICTALYFMPDFAGVRLFLIKD
ncbi:hypothetical protein MKK67_20820 [Methylobacterium sp. J-072]|uniref:hypothetical protein n=1 Tax=Methylobacterium sp. J-072 TaxID=2836651 RepID=UPI001FB8EB65|nr:hypothetical protein [Methylobacterium sp. J-072]MCJ2094924.1 hypothetical protein [Methylobacterium sp. J-072]